MYWIHLLWYFIIISFLGWLFSSLYHFFSEKKFYDNGFLTLPFCPAYGAGAVICYVVFKPLTDNFLIFFIGSALLLSFFTVIAGFIGKKILGCKPWDYSNLKFNIGSYLTFPFVVIIPFKHFVHFSLVHSEPVLCTKLLLTSWKDPCSAYTI